MSLTETQFEKTMQTLGFRPSEWDLAMTANVSGVEITAVESPAGIHLTFSRVSARTATQYQVQVPSGTAAPMIAAVIVQNIEHNFPDAIKETAR